MLTVLVLRIVLTDSVNQSRLNSRVLYEEDFECDVKN